MDARRRGVSHRRRDRRWARFAQPSDTAQTDREPAPGPWGSLVYPWWFGTTRLRFKSGRTHLQSGSEPISTLPENPFRMVRVSPGSRSSLGYAALREGPTIDRWYRDVARGSGVTADLYLRSL